MRGAALRQEFGENDQHRQLQNRRLPVDENAVQETPAAEVLPVSDLGEALACLLTVIAMETADAITDQKYTEEQEHAQ